MNLTKQCRIGARGSKLSLWQANHIADCLRAAHPGLVVSIKTYLTAGDKFLEAPLAQIGGKGLFTKEIETAILNGEVDIAVHSLKDMPAELPPGLALAAVTERIDASDAFVSNTFERLADLPLGAKVGTSSLRRRAQVLAFRPDLCIENVRGNVDTRLRKLDEGGYDAIILAAAGLKRLGLAERIKQLLPQDICLPAVGQGVLAIEARAGDTEVRQLVSCLEHPTTRVAITAEREFLKIIEGNCRIPVGVFGQANGNKLLLQAVILSPDGRERVYDRAEGEAKDAIIIGRELARRMLASGGRQILALSQCAEEKR